MTASFTPSTLSSRGVRTIPSAPITTEKAMLRVNPWRAMWLASAWSPAPTARDTMARTAVSSPMRPVMASIDHCWAAPMPASAIIPNPQAAHTKSASWSMIRSVFEVIIGHARVSRFFGILPVVRSRRAPPADLPPRLSPRALQMPELG